MAEFNTPAGVAALLGDRGATGRLTGAVRSAPRSVVVLDHMEAAHTDVQLALLPMLGEGRLTDGDGDPVDFRDAVVVMTATAGSENASTSSGFGFSREDAAVEYERVRERTLIGAEKYFRPEFLARLGDVVAFRTLERAHVRQIVEARAAAVRPGNGIEVVVADEAIDHLTASAYQADRVAWAAIRAIERELEGPLGEEVLRGTIPPGSLVRTVLEQGHDGKGRIKFEVTPGAG